jgi:hypothetical protein
MTLQLQAVLRNSLIGDDCHTADFWSESRSAAAE